MIGDAMKGVEDHKIQATGERRQVSNLDREKNNPRMGFNPNGDCLGLLFNSYLNGYLVTCRGDALRRIESKGCADAGAGTAPRRTISLALISFP